MRGLSECTPGPHGKPNPSKFITTFTFSTTTCHAVGTDHFDPQIQHDCFMLSSLAGDNPIRNIAIHHCEFKIDWKEAHGGMMSITGVDSL
jgi:hypothetical protein